MSKHTPGPWTVKKGEMPYITQDTGTFEDGPIVATLVNDFKYQERGQITANARLIAAAPELLSTLEYVRATLVDMYGHVPKHATHRSMLEQLAATIAKAEGKS